MNSEVRLDAAVGQQLLDVALGQGMRVCAGLELRRHAHQVATFVLQTRRAVGTPARPLVTTDRADPLPW
jgi:hypothetical protein